MVRFSMRTETNRRHRHSVLKILRQPPIKNKGRLENKRMELCRFSQKSRRQSITRRRRRKNRKMANLSLQAGIPSLTRRSMAKIRRAIHWPTSGNQRQRHSNPTGSTNRREEERRQRGASDRRQGGIVHSKGHENS